MLILKGIVGFFGALRAPAIVIPPSVPLASAAFDGHEPFLRRPSLAPQNEKVEKGEKGEKENLIC